MCSPTKYQNSELFFIFYRNICCFIPVARFPSLCRWHYVEKSISLCPSSNLPSVLFMLPSKHHKCSSVALNNHLFLFIYSLSFWTFFDCFFFSTFSPFEGGFEIPRPLSCPFYTQNFFFPLFPVGV